MNKPNVAIHPRKEIQPWVGRSQPSIAALKKEWFLCLIPVPFWISAQVFGSDIVATLAAVVGTLISLAWWKSLLRNQGQMLGYLKLGGMSLLTIMSVTWLVAAYFNVIILNQSISHTLEWDVGTNISWYAGAVEYTLAFASVLAAIGAMPFLRRLEKSAAYKLLSVRLIPIQNFRYLLIALSLLDAWLVLSGVVSYRAFNVTGYHEGKLAWFIPVLEIMLAAQIGLNALAIYNFAVHQVSSSRFLTLVVTLASVSLTIFISFTKGRIEFIFCAISHIYWLCFFLGRIPRLSRLLPVIIIAIPVLYTGTLLNNFMRSGDAKLGNLQGVGIIGVLNSAISTWEIDESLRAVERARSAENLGTRPLLANPLAKSMALPSSQMDFMFGENLFNSLIWSIPSSFVGNKAEFPIQENLLYQYFPIGSGDIADSPYLYAYTDFSYLGIIIYPIILSLLWIISLLTIKVASPWTTLVIACMWLSFFTISIGEASIVGWFTNLRNVFFVLPFGIAAGKLFSLSRRLKIIRK